jgi:hypothetical protein
MSESGRLNFSMAGFRIRLEPTDAKWSERTALHVEHLSPDDSTNAIQLSVQLPNAPIPSLVIACAGAAPSIFPPVALIAPETNVLFFGYGERAAAFSLDPPTRLWTHTTDAGCLGWAQHGDSVVLLGELELACWSSSGAFRWSTFVEPPWDYRVEGDEVVLDIMGKLSRFPIASGP